MSFRLVRLTFWLLAFAHVAGCRNQSAKDAPVAPTRQSSADDRTHAALETFRQANEAGPLREALDHLNANLARPDVADRLTLSVDDRANLKADAGLTAAELAELEAPVFRPIDAVAIEQAMLFRDAARTLEIPGLTPLQQAEFVFDWTSRHVLFYEQRHDDLPPAFVLRAGHGGAVDRGLVFLAIAQQLGLDGCLLGPADAADLPLAGVVVDRELYLFDCRLGLPIRDPGGAIATWSGVRKNPELLKASKIAPNALETWRARLPAPIESLSPRMRYLESLLHGEEAHIGADRLRVHVDLPRLKRAVESAGVTTASPHTRTLRAIRDFAPVDDGGKDVRQRTRRFTSDLIPWPPVLERYHELQLLADIPPPARDTLLKITSDLFERYYRQPGEMLERGKTDALPRRLERIRAVVDDAEFSAGDADTFAPRVADWRQRVKKAYLAALRDPSAAEAVREIWEEDQYLLYLIQQPDLEDIPRSAVKKELSRIVLSAARRPLAARVNWLFALLSEDRALRLAESAALQKNADRTSKSTAVNLRNAWLNARGAWNQYLDRNNLGPTIYATSLPEIRRFLDRGEFDRALNQWEYLQTELHHYAAARLGLARAMENLGQPAGSVYEDLRRELRGLIETPEIATALKASAAAGIANAIDGPRRWQLLTRDWGADGTLAWLAESIRLREDASRTK